MQECGGGYPERHTQGDVTELLKQHWDIVIAFPPCTYMTNGGAVRMYPQKGIIDKERYKKAMKITVKHIKEMKMRELRNNL